MLLVCVISVNDDFYLKLIWKTFFKSEAFLNKWTHSARLATLKTSVEQRTNVSRINPAPICLSVLGGPDQQPLSNNPRAVNSQWRHPSSSMWRHKLAAAVTQIVSIERRSAERDTGENTRHKVKVTAQHVKVLLYTILSVAFMQDPKICKNLICRILLIFSTCLWAFSCSR